MVLLILNSVSKLLIKILSPGVLKKKKKLSKTLPSNEGDTEVKCSNTIQVLLWKCVQDTERTVREDAVNLWGS